MIRNHTLERQARAAHQPHRLREIGLRVSGFVLSKRWWKGITSLFTRRSHRARTVTPAQRKRALPIIAPPTLGSTASTRTGLAPESTRR